MRLVLCDGNRILCEALAACLAERGHQVVAVTTTAADGLAAVAAYRPDLVMLDVCCPAGTEGPRAEGAEGLRVITVTRKHYPGTAVLVLSSLAGPETWAEAKKIGVAGFLRKDKRVSEIAEVLDLIAGSRTAAEPRLFSPPQRRLARRHTLTLSVLTPREKEVLRRIVAGQSTVQMAREMNITASTLRTYVKNVLTKLGAHSRLQAAAFATRGNLLSELSA